MSTLRVAAAQFHVNADLEGNLSRSLAAVDEAAAGGAQLVVLPEFCNHLSWYQDKAHCWNVSVELDGPWLGALAEKAREHSLYLVVNATVRRGPDAATGTSLLYGPDGALLAESDKQVLMGHENDFLERAQKVCPVVETPIGRIGMYSCMDGVINETPRSLALRGAQILCNSLNSFAYDEGDLHVPVRGPENRVWIVAANKVGPLIPEEMLAPVSEATHIPEHHLYGAGDSQIVAPNGAVLARGDRSSTSVVFADIDPSQADDKTRPDGTDVFANRRPELYQAIGQPLVTEPLSSGVAQARAAVYQPAATGVDAIAEVSAMLKTLPSEVAMVVLPELFCFVEPSIGTDISEAQQRSEDAISALSASCPSQAVVVTSLVRGEQHMGIVLGSDGILLEQPQLHACARHGADRAGGQEVSVLELSWGRLAVVVGDDALYPESFRLAAFAGAEVVAAPVHVIEPWEVETGLVERAAENRLSLVYATRPEVGTSAVLGLHDDFTLLSEWEARVFDGNISSPLITRAAAAPGLTVGTIHPAAAANKMISSNTHLIDGRPWHLVDAITGA